MDVRLPARARDRLRFEREHTEVVGEATAGEDRIEALQIGPITLRLVKPCTRCIITATDQRTGERSTNPLPVLRKFRFDRALLGVTFGENAVISAGSGLSLSRGDECVTLAGD